MHVSVPCDGPALARVRSSCSRSTLIALFALAGLGAWSGVASAQTFSIDRAEWSGSDGGRLRVEGTGTDGRTVTIRNAGNNAVLGTDTVDGDEWSRRFSRLTQVPCTVSAQQSGSTTVVTRAVSNRPANCGPVVGAQPSISVNDVTVTEGATANFTVSLSAASTQTVTVLASTGGGTATAGSDYTARSNVTLSFAPGTTTQTFAVATINDTAVEPTETFNVTLTSATNATIADGTGVGTITDNDVAQNATFSINDVTVTEGGTASFTVTRAGNTTTAVSVVASTANGTAVAPGDFTARANVTLSFAAGVTIQTFAVTTINDTAAEPTETFTVNLTTPSAGATIADAQGIGTITDNDQVANCNPAVNGNHNGCFVNQLTGAREYTGPAQCVACHETQARNMHNSVHYQQNGPTDFVTNINGDAGEGPAGKPSGVNAVIGINTYCGTHENSPRFTCAGCHVGNGRFPKTEQELAALPRNDQLVELANIDCLMCHQQVYKRFPDWTASSEGFSDLVLQNVALAADGVSLVESPGSTVTRTGFQGIPNVNALTLDFQFRPAGAAGSVIPLPGGIPAAFGAMTVTTEVAAETLHRTTRQSCLNCHAGAAGANGAKRGDLSTANVASTDLNLDRHMATNGSNYTCSTCHNVDDTPTINDTGRPSTHRVRGRGLDLRANDHATRFTCDNAGCHNAATVHNAVSGTGLLSAARLTRHTNKVACQTCHIPRYGKAVATEVARDWQNPHVTQTACNGRGGWLPNEIKSSTANPPVPVTPSYQWFDGRSEVYYLTESLNGTPTKPLPADIASQFSMATGTAAYIMGRPTPNSGASTPATGLPVAKIYPMKEHWGKLARNTANNTLIPHSTFEFFRTGSFCRAIAQALGQNPDTACTGRDTNGDGIADGAPTGAQIVPVHTYQTINHGVEPQANSLGAAGACGSCHSVNGMTGGPARMDLKGQLGYRVRTTIGWTVNATGTSTCANSCHSSKSASFTSFHERSQHTSAGCNACHDQITGR